MNIGEGNAPQVRYRTLKWARLEYCVQSFMFLLSDVSLIGAAAQFELC